VIEGEVTRFYLDLRDRSAFTLSGSVNFDGDAPGPWTAKLRPVVEIDSLTEHYYRPQKLDPTGAFQCTAPHLGLHRLTISGTLADGTEVWMRDQLELSSGDHEWSFAVDLVSIAGTFEAAGGILRYQRGVGDRVLFITLRRDDDGTFSGRVPVGAGSITFRPAGGKSRVLRTLDVPSGGRVGIELSK